MKGSMTVEAIFVTFVLMLALMWLMKTSITLYQYTVEVAKMNWIDVNDAATTFRSIFFVREMLP